MSPQNLRLIHGLNRGERPAGRVVAVPVPVLGAGELAGAACAAVKLHCVMTAAELSTPLKPRKTSAAAPALRMTFRVFICISPDAPQMWDKPLALASRKAFFRDRYWCLPKSIEVDEGCATT